jgi:hypothetical protein
VDGSYVFAAGVKAGIDGALRLAAELRGDATAQAIQLDMAYAPEPPFDSGTPETAPPAILQQARQFMQDITARREETARLPGSVSEAINNFVKYEPVHSRRSPFDLLASMHSGRQLDG